MRIVLNVGTITPGLDMLHSGEDILLFLPFADGQILGEIGNAGERREGRVGGERGVAAKIACACTAWLKSSDSGPVYKEQNCLLKLRQNRE